MKEMSADQAERLVKAALKRELQNKGINCYDLVEHREWDSGTLTYRITGFKQALVIRWSLGELKEREVATQGED